MPHFIPGNSWQKDGNHDSSLTFEEVRAIALRICDEVTGMKTPPQGMDQEFRTLSAALQNKLDPQPPIFIDKGIHEEGQLHFTLKVKAAYKGAFHVYLNKGTKETVYTQPVANKYPATKFKTVGMVMPHTFYQYKSVGLTFEVSKKPRVFKYWPTNFAPATMSYGNRKRGDSFSAANIQPIMSRLPNSAETKSGKMIHPKT